MAKKAEEGKVSKADAVRAALKAGHDKPQAASDYIKATFGLDVTPQVVSTYKSIENKRSEKKAAKKSATATPVAASTPAPKKAGMDGHMANPADLARGVKSLIEQFGAAAVTDMTKVFE